MSARVCIFALVMLLLCGVSSMPAAQVDSTAIAVPDTAQADSTEAAAADTTQADSTEIAAPDSAQVDSTAAAVADTTQADSTAVAAPDPVLAEGLPSALAALDSARVAAHNDRHAEAIRYYRRAIALYPPLEAQLAVELGHQYMWSDKPDSSWIWFQKQLEYEPANIEARLGVARLTSWKDDHTRAETLYREVLEDDPGNIDAMLGHAQVVNWSGRNREATWLYNDILRLFPGNTDAREGLAQAYYWGGRPDWARQVIDDGPRTPGLNAVETNITRDRARAIRYTFDRNHDSDDITRSTHTIRAGVGVADERRVSGEYTHARYTQPDRPDVSRNALAAIYESRFNEYVGLTAAAGYEWNSFDRAALGPESWWRDDFNLFTFDGYVTFLPHDWARIDVGLFRGSLQNPDAIFRGVTVTELSVGLDLRFDTNKMWVTSFQSGWYSDANNRLGFDTRFAWQPFWRLPLGFGNRFTSTTGLAIFGFSQSGDNGYYDPNQYVSFYEDLALELRFSPHVRGEIAGRIAMEREDNDDWFAAGSGRAAVTWNIWKGLGLTVGGYASQSRLTSREGYQADGFYISLEYLEW